MGKINLGRVILGGLVAGLIINIGEYFLNEPILGERWRAVMESLNRSPVGGSAVAVFMVGGFILGITMIWTYAAIRPRLGAGLSTAICAGLLVWFFVYLYPASFYLAMNLFPSSLVLLTTLWGFFELPIAAAAGAWLYQE
jgi:hypothetical protein